MYAEETPPTLSTPVIAIEALGGNAAEVPGWQPALGQGISEMLMETLESSDKKFQVLEIAESAGPQPAPRSGGSNHSADGKAKAAGSPTPTAGDATSSAKPDIGGPADSDFTFCGEVTQFMVQSSGSKVGDFVSSSPFASLGAKVSTAHVQIVWRIVDSETKKVVKRGITACSASGSDFDMTALTTTDGKTAMAGSATAFARTAGGGKKATNNYGNIFKGLILGDASSGAGGGNSAGSSNGITAKSAKVSTQAAPKAGGDSAGNSSETTTKPARTSSQTVPSAGNEVAGNGGDSIGGTISYGNPTFMNSALGKATAKAVTDIIKQLDTLSLPEPGRLAKLKTDADALRHTPGKVLAVASKDTIIVSLGSKEGFKAGDLLELYQLTDVKDDKGIVVFTDEKPVGEITLSAVQEERSRGAYAGDAQVQQGWTVKAR